MVESITIKRPDDWHIHLREGDMLDAVLPFTATIMGRAVAMPNLSTPLTTPELVRSYYDELKDKSPRSGFEPLVPLYLTDTTPVEYVQHVKACKYYPVGATTNSANGVTDYTKLRPVWAEMERLQIPLQIHCEVTDKDVDMFDRERVFLDTVLTPLLTEFPKIKVVVEHISTAYGVEFVKSHASRVAGTITAHHLMITRTDILDGGLNPHHFCFPVVKGFEDRDALRQAATSGLSCFFLGTDSAPHTIENKLTKGRAGIFTAPHAIEYYAQVFDEMNALDKLENFASVYGAQYYNYPLNTDTITLVNKPHTVEKQVDDVAVFMGEETLNWKVQ